MGLCWDIGKCVDCGEYRKVAHQEWNKAAVPRCCGCGGRLEPSKATRREHAFHASRKQELKERKDRLTSPKTVIDFK